MAQLIGCPQCAATHRVVAAQTRFTCDFCRTQISVAERTGVEELMIPIAVARRQAREEALRHLRSRDVPFPRVDLGEPRYVPMWHLASRAGEELVIPGLREQIPLLRSIGIPAAPMVSVQDDGREELPAPDVTRKDAEAAAFNAFVEGDRTLASVRLIWMPVISLAAEFQDGVVAGLYVAGADRVYFDPLPVAATDPPVRPPLLVAYLGFLVLALGVGAQVAPVGTRAMAELLVLAVGLGLWTLWIQRRWSSS